MRAVWILLAGVSSSRIPSNGAELLGRGSNAGNRLDGCCDRLALMDAVGNIRGYYDLASASAMRQLKTDIRTLALNMR